MFYLLHLGTPPTFTTKTSVERKTTAANVKTSEGVHIIVEKITSSTLTPEPTEPTLTQKKQPATKVSTTPSTEKKPFVIKVEVEQEQKAGDAEEKLQEDDKEKSEGVFVVQKVTEEEEENKQTAEEPETFKVSKVTNDETDWNEEADLESGKTGGNERPKETVGNAAVTTPVKTAEIGITVEKITPSPKSPTKSTQSEVVKVERVPSKQNVETKRSSVERIEEDEDLKVGGAAQSPDGEGKVEVTVEKESTETSSAKESSPAKAGQKDIIVEVKKVSPSTDEEVKEVEVIAKPTVKPTATKEVSTSQGKVEEVSISVEKITVPPSHVQRPTSGKSQTSMVSKVVKLTSEDEDLETSLDAVNYKRSDDASEKTSNSEEEALELELEGDKDNIDEQKLAQEFDKALEAERNGKENLKTDQPVQPAEGPKTTRPPQVTTGKAKPTTEAKGDGADNQLEHLNVEAVVEKMKVRKIMSDEEMELAELAQESMNDEDKEQVKPTKKPTTATSQEVVIKVEKVPKVTVQVTKERNENLLSEEETAKEEKKLKVELVNELEQEKEGVSISDYNTFHRHIKHINNIFL